MFSPPPQRCEKAKLSTAVNVVLIVVVVDDDDGLNDVVQWFSDLLNNTNHLRSRGAT